MNDKFRELYESINTIKLVKFLRYPKQIQLSGEFREALAKEIFSHMDILDESRQPIRDLCEKFTKALKFEITELMESKRLKDTSKTQIKLRPRQKWDINPNTRIVPSAKGKYNRAKQKQEMNKE